MGFRGARFQCRDRWLEEVPRSAKEGADAVARGLDSVRFESDWTHDDLPSPDPCDPLPRQLGALAMKIGKPCG